MSEDSPRLLIVEDDDRFAETLAAEFQDRGYSVSRAANLEELRALDTTGVGYSIVDLRLRNDSGLDAVSEIKEHSPHARIVMLTGYGSIATAVQSTKLGATQYLTKPIEIDELERALLSDDYEATEIPNQFQSLDRHEREYIEWVLAQCDGNISQAARRLGLHRQSLQRKLRKFTPLS
ncbi:MAG: response regulator [Myxococcota bacterium]|nr:response regulator [Myxococcota bacterium]